jgi:U2-associated protein SR140
MAAPPKATPFAFASASSSPAFAASTAQHGGAVTAFSLDNDSAADDSAAAAALSAATKSAAAAKKGKKRNIDMFLEELKQNEQDKALGLAPRERERGGGPGGPVDLGEPGSTNMYVNNLPLDVTERRLAELFAEHGDVASVKIMWPRADERTPTTTATRLHCGFVSFMRREDAETAMQEMQNKFVGEGAQLKLNWSRALPLPTHPYMHKIRHGASSNGSGGGFGSGPSSSSSKTAASEPVPLPAPVADSFPFPPDAIKYQVELPADRELRALIDLVASHVVAQGLPLEQALCARAVAAAAAAPGTTPDASLAFLAHPASLEALYYRWRVYSLAQGDSLRHWRSTPFQMVAGGPFFVPPDWARLTRAEERRKDERRRAREAKRDTEREAERQERRRADRERDRERERDRSAAADMAAASSLSKNVGNWDRNVTGGVVEKGVERGRLSASAAAMLTSLLRSVNLDRSSVRDCMGWCMDHADASVDVVACVADSLTLDETPLAKKVARLYVVSDLLYNSSAPVANASSFRTRLQEALPAILHSFHRAHARALSEGGRITADALRTKVTATLRAWNQWGVFPHTFLAKLEDIFNKGDPSAATSASASTPATSAATNAAP